MIAANVRPWKLFSNEMILYFSLAVARRASLIAPSFASAPELQKKHLPPNDVVAIHSARRP